jgi:hypothetical protein
MTEAAAEELI